MNYWLVPHLSDANYPRFGEHPPLLFMLEGLFFKIAGSDFLQARLFSGLWGMGVIAAMLYWMRITGMERVGRLATLLLMAMPFYLKKVRFPGLDIPLTFFFVLAHIFYWRAMQGGLRRDWCWLGLSFGLALLMKGPPALLLAASLGLHILVTRQWAWMLRPQLYLSFMLGLLIFSLWPLGLYAAGHGDIFEFWYKRQILGTMVDARGLVEGEVSHFAYLIHFAKYAAPALLLLLVAWYKLWRPKDKGAEWALQSSWLWLMSCWFFAVTFFLSCMKWKYSHYLLPAYPALCLLAAWALDQWRPRLAEKIECHLPKLVIAAAMVLVIFPLGTTSSRHPELFAVERQMAERNQCASEWYIVDDAYEFWAATNLNAYLHHGNTHAIAGAEMANLPSGAKLLLTRRHAVLPAAVNRELLWSNARIDVYVVDAMPCH